MSAVVLAASTPLSALRRSLAMPIALLVIVAALYVVVQAVLIGNDVSYQLWVGRQLRSGAVFGRDIAEVNPPLWFWEGAVLSAASDHLRVAQGHVVVFAHVARTALSAGLTIALIDGLTIRRRVAAGAGLMALLFVLPLRDYGQRDVIMMLGTLPYAVLIARRRANLLTSRRLVWAVALFAGYGLILKPHFLTVPLVLEIWLIIGAGRGWRPLRTETLVLAGMAMVYVAAVAVWTPAYLIEMVPALRDSYGAFGPPFANLILAQPYAPVWAVAAVILLTRWRRLSVSIQAFGVLALGCALSYLLQAKGFSYHAAPITIVLLGTLWLMLCEGRAIAPGVLRVFTLATLAATLAMAWMIGPYRADDLGAVSARLRQLPAGSTVAIISAHNWDAFPLVEEKRFVWPFRAASLWVLPALIQHANPALGQRVLDEVADDLSCHPPHAILFDDPERAFDMAGHGFSYRRFVEREPRIAAQLTRYRVTARHGRMTLIEGVPQRPRAGCRRVAVRPEI